MRKMLTESRRKEYQMMKGTNQIQIEIKRGQKLFMSKLEVRYLGSSRSQKMILMNQAGLIWGTKGCVGCDA
eukprot:213069-Karenia_brevis.AAC.1